MYVIFPYIPDVMHTNEVLPLDDRVCEDDVLNYTTYTTSRLNVVWLHLFHQKTPTKTAVIKRKQFIYDRFSRPL